MRLFILPHRLSLSLGLSGCLALFGVRVLASEDDLIRQPGSELCCPGEPSVEPEDNITPLAGLTTDPPLFFEQINLEDTAETSANASVGDLDGDGDLDVVLAKGRRTRTHANGRVPHTLAIRQPEWLASIVTLDATSESGSH